MNDIIIGQILGIIATVATVRSYQANTKRGVLIIQTVSRFLSCFLPYPGILVGISLKLGAINVEMLKVNMFGFKDLFIDILKNHFDGIPH